MKPLAQIAYEAFTSANGTPAVPWGEIADSNPRRGSPVALKAWKAVADAVAREITRRNTRPSETVKCRCGARHMRGESHICNDDPKLIARLAGRG